MTDKVTIEIHSEGDVWTNRDSVIQQLGTVSVDQVVIIHTRFEGISLAASGVLAVLGDWVASTGRDPSTVKVNTPNQYETIPYQFENNPTVPHFFKPSLLKYHRACTAIDPDASLFGLFVGRYTAMRNTMARDMLHGYSDHTVISVMNTPRLGATNWWDPEVEQIGSLDNFDLMDHYNHVADISQSLLQFYDRFQIEIVSETVTLGDSFFPTEKTIRPIVGSKPFLSYATRGFLSRLRDLGFQTFDKLWSEHYDQLEGADRWHQIKIVIDSIIEQGYDRNLANKIVQYNYAHQKTITNSRHG